jgi:iron(III) transport system substrate-binding protein
MRRKTPCQQQPVLRGWLALVVGLALVGTACAGGSPASTPAGSSSGGASSAAGAAAQGGGADWEQQWNELVAAARQEGRLVALGPPTPELRRRVPEAFQRRFGITVEYTGQASGDYAARLDSERRAGIYSTDIVVAGANSMYEVIAGSGQIENGTMGMLAPLRPVLLLPEVLDTSRYRTGRLLFMDPAGEYVLRTANFTGNAATINTDLIQPSAIQSVYDLLKPEYRGKIAAYDPTIPGAGISDAAYKYERLGRDYLKQLFVDQEVVITRDHRQTADLLARGSNPIALYLQEQAVADLLDQGLPALSIPRLQGIAPTVSGGFSYIGLMDRAPHPNAAKVFVNWMMSQAGQQLWQDAQRQASIRNDLDETGYPSWFRVSVPDPAVDYFDSQNWEFVVVTTPRLLPELKQIIGTR